MKKIMCLIFLCIPSVFYGQIQIGTNEVPTMNRPGKISKEELLELKNTTTLFTLQYKDYDELSSYEMAIKSVWTFTPFKIIRPDEMKDYAEKENYSFFSFGGFMTSKQGPGISAANMHLSYDLWKPFFKKNGNSKRVFFARIQIYPDNKTFFTAMRNVNKRKDNFSSQMLSFLYNESIIYNWGAGFLKGYLKMVNEHMDRKEERGPYTEVFNEKELSSLQQDTLFVPDYVRVKFNMFTGSETVDEDSDDEDIHKAYPFPIKIIPAAELNNKILKQQQSFKYLVYVKSSTDKYINVFESATGKLLYARYTAMSYNFKNKDLGKVAKSFD